MKTLFTFAIALVIGAVSAQIDAPQPSPTATLEQKVGLTDIKLVYSRPGMKERKVFGELVAYDKIWRTGANKATAITFSTDVTVGGKEVKEGTYSIFTIPGEKEWTVILNSNTELWGTGGYKEEEDVARFTVTPSALTESVETFTMDFSNFTNSDATLYLAWENTKVAFTISTPALKMVEEQITNVLVEGPSAGTYYSAARFYLENDKDLNTALEWINIAIEKRNDAFWYVYQKARILKALGKKDEAKATAEKSMEMAKANEDGDYGYVKRNQDLIDSL